MEVLVIVVSVSLCFLFWIIFVVFFWCCIVGGIVLDGVEFCDGVFGCLGRWLDSYFEGVC